MIEKAWDWNKINNTYWETPDEYMYFLVEKWKDLSKKQLLDLGCGVGRHSLLFAKNDYDVTSVDISQSGLDKVQNKAKELGVKVNTKLSNITQLDFPSNKFDSVIAFNSIYHTDKKGFEKAISEIKRVLKNNGEAFITLLSKEDPSYELNSDKIVDENTRMKFEEDGSELPHFFVASEEIGNLFNEFKIISVKQVTEYFNSDKHIHYNLLLKLEEKDGNKNF